VSVGVGTSLNKNKMNTELMVLDMNGELTNLLITLIRLILISIFICT
jgi:hypothetical protein